jgi:uncharacterized peroxidase-related enzyme
VTRLPALDPAHAHPKAKEALDGLQKSIGATPNIYKTLASSPAALTALLQMQSALRTGALRAKTREAISIALAEYNGCDYCLSAHSVRSKSAGLDDAAIEQARAGGSADPQVDAAVKFALAVAAARGAVTDEAITNVRAAGLGDAEIVEIVANVAANLFTNYLNNVARTEIDFPPVQTKRRAA